MRILLDGQQMQSRGAAHDHLQRQLSLPDYYGRNLDALFDLLAERGGETELVLIHGEALAELGPYGEKLLTTLREAAAENPGLQFEME